MPLSAPAERRPIHTRQIACQGFRRPDGLWDIEGHLTDVKSYAFPNEFRGTIEPGDPIHAMWIRLTIDDDFNIHTVEAVTDKAPFHLCGDIAPNFQRLVGLRIGPGWNRAVKERLGGIEGCTHLVELLGPVATTAFQTIYPILARERAERNAQRRPALLNTCHAFASTGPVVKKYWPDHYEDDCAVSEP